MPAHTSKVNLMPPSEFESSFWGKFLKWAVTTGRYIIILTEMVVIIAFLMRFKLDEDVRNLNEQISGQVSYLESQQQQEVRFLALQNKLVLADQMLEARTEPTKMLAYMKERIHPEIAVKSRSVSLKEISISALTLSNGLMGQLMATLSADPVWKNLDVTELVGDKINGIKFTLVAKR